MKISAILEEALAAKTPVELRQILDRLGEADWEALRGLFFGLHGLGGTPPAISGETCDFVVQGESGTPPPPPQAVVPPTRIEERKSKADPTTDETQVLGEKYKLRERLGVGGMGEVYAAEQIAPVRRRVAVKIIKAGISSKQILSRFEQERQALALMDHPNIARIFDGGTTSDGQPFFVMELVKGLSIARYADQEKLTLRERLALYLPVCHAVQHAHQKGIIHRDLKPSNILVGLVDGQPTPKIIDFGVAKALHGPLGEQSVYTELNTVIGTLEYMSPEQAEFNNLDIDTRTDVYSLGVVLYELLAGVLPFHRKENLLGALDTILKVIREVEPVKPSVKAASAAEAQERAAHRKLEPAQLAQALHGDLDWIILKCLEKERERRYGTALSLAADLERYLHDEPVLAAPPSTVYRIKKIWRRHRGKILLGGAVFVLLVGSVIATTAGMLAAIKAEKQAAEEAAIHKALVEFIEDDVFAAMDASERPALGISLEEAVKVRTLLSLAAQKLDRGRFAGQPLVEAAMRLTMGRAFLAIGDSKNAMAQLERGDALRRAHLGDLHPLRLDALEQRCRALVEFAEPAAAQQLVEQLQAARRQVNGPHHADTLKAQFFVCCLLERRGEWGKAQEQLLELFDAQARHLSAKHIDTLASQRLLATVLFRRYRVERVPALLVEAETTARQALQGYRETVGLEHPGALATLNLQGSIQQAQHDFAAAEKTYDQLIKASEKSLGPDHPYLLVFKSNLASCFLSQKQYARAEPLFREAIAVLERIEPEHPVTLILQSNLANVYLQMHDYRRAVELYAMLEPRFLAKFGEARANTWNLLTGVTGAQLGDGQAPQALATCERLLAILDRQPKTAERDMYLGIALGLFVRSHLLLNQPHEAQKHLRKRLEQLPSEDPLRSQIESLLSKLAAP